jgi:hypothetical protein
MTPGKAARLKRVSEGCGLGAEEEVVGIGNDRPD